MNQNRTQKSTFGVDTNKKKTQGRCKIHRWKMLIELHEADLEDRTE